MGRCAADKILTIEQATALRDELAAAGTEVVLTNGCFDVIHVGHIRYLEEARRLGGFLIVAVNSDAGVRCLKGEGRPINPEMDRAEIIAALGCVDVVVIFSERTAEAVVRCLRPSIYVKGGDYSEEQIPEARIAHEVGARVVIASLVPGKSTTALVDAICKNES